MNIQNSSILDANPGDPNGYVTKDLEWAAVPWGKKFVVIHNGHQVHTANNYQTAKSYIQKQIKLLKRNQPGPLDKFV
jgi:hypothetical protein